MAGPWEDYQNAERPPWEDFSDKPDSHVGEVKGIDKALFAARSAAEGHTAGLSEPLISRIKALISSGSEALRAPLGAATEYEMNEAEHTPEFEAAIQKDVAQRQAEKKANPGLDLASQIFGGIIPSPINVGTKVFKGAETTVKGIKALQAAKEASMLARGASKIATSAGAGALGGAGYEAVKQAAERPDGFIEGGDSLDDILNAAKFGGALGGGIPVVAGALKGGASAAGWLGKKTFSSLFGVAENNIDKYMANSERINAAPDLPQIKDQVDDAVAKIKEAHDSGQMSVKDAEEAMKELKRDIQFKYSDAKVDAREAARKAEEHLKDAYEKSLEPLQSKRLPTDKAGNIVDMVHSLKDGVNKGSEDAMMLLRNTEDVLPTAPIKAGVTQAIKKYGVEGAGPISDKGAAAVQSLERFQGRLEKLPKKLALEEFKQLVKQLDQDINWKDGAGQYMDAASADKVAIRRQMDEILKNASPEYREAMIPVAEKANLLGQASKRFGDERRAISTLSSAASPKGAPDLELLAQLENQTGRSGEVTGPVREYTAARQTLSDPEALNQIRQGLPEYQAYRAAAANLARRNPKWTRAQITAELAGSKEARALAMAEEAAGNAKSEFEPFKSLTPASTESKLRALTQNSEKGIENREALKALGDKTGTDFLQALDDLNVKQSFEKGAASGSRNTLIWTVMGGVFGGLPGAGGGAAFGQMVDRYGPKMAKTIMDGVIAVKNNPKLEVIKSLNVPPEVKEELEKGMRLYLINPENSQSSRRVAGKKDEKKRMPAKNNAKLKALED